jgi:hypothetical protein
MQKLGYDVLTRCWRVRSSENAGEVIRDWAHPIHSLQDSMLIIQPSRLSVNPYEAFINLGRQHSKSVEADLVTLYDWWSMVAKHLESKVWTSQANASVTHKLKYNPDLRWTLSSFRIWNCLGRVPDNEIFCKQIGAKPTRTKNSDQPAYTLPVINRLSTLPGSTMRRVLREEKGAIVMGLKITFADAIVASILKWIRMCLGPESKEWKDVESRNGGRGEITIITAGLSTEVSTLSSVLSWSIIIIIHSSRSITCSSFIWPCIWNIGIDHSGQGTPKDCEDSLIQYFLPQIEQSGVPDVHIMPTYFASGSSMLAYVKSPNLYFRSPHPRSTILTGNRNLDRIDESLLTELDVDRGLRYFHTGNYVASPVTIIFN